MSDYREQTARPSAGDVGTPALACRKDKPADLAGGTDQNKVVLQVDAGGALRVSQEGGLPTYFGNSQFACDSTATDIAHLPGNATTVVHLQWVRVSSIATSAATGRLSVIKRRTLDTGQTAVSSSLVPADSGDAAPSSTPQHFTGHPTALGTSTAPAGVIDSVQYGQQASGTVAIVEKFFDFRHLNGGKGLRVAGAAEAVCLNAVAALGGSGNAWDVTWCWKESPLTA